VDVADAQRGVKEELEGRSAYMKQVLADRAALADMIADLTAQITSFKPQDVFQVEAFTEELERRLALLSDERMVLKAFSDWPEKKVEAMREAVARKGELERLTASLDPNGATWSAKDSINDELQQVLERFQEGKAKVESYLRSKDDIRRSLAAHSIPLDEDSIRAAQHKPLALAKYALSMVLTATQRLALLSESEAAPARPGVQAICISALNLAFQIHQFVGGFDGEATQLFSDVHHALSDQQAGAPHPDHHDN